MNDDYTLIARAQEGEQQAISQLYQDNIRQVYRFVYYKVGNKEDAEDITQDVMIAAFKGLQNFRREATFRNWCYEIAKHKIADMWRERYKMPTMDIEAVLGLDTSTTMVMVEDEQEAETHDHTRRAQVQEVFAQLKENYRKVLEYRFLLNYSIKETAVAMDVSVSNAKVLQHRALKAAARLGYPTIPTAVSINQSNSTS